MSDDRFWAKVTVADSGCWEWQASRFPAGYGKFWLNGKTERAHRVAYMFSVGPIPEGLEIDHKCVNPPCVRPDHLEAVTSKVNSQRSKSANREKTHCPQGHPYSGDNLYRRNDGGRECRACHRERQRRYYNRKQSVTQEVTNV